MDPMSGPFDPGPFEPAWADDPLSGDTWALDETWSSPSPMVEQDDHTASPFSVALATLASLTTPALYLATVLGMLQAAMFLGVSLGPLLGGVFVDLFGFRLGFLVAGTIMFALTVLVTALVPDPRKHARAAGASAASKGAPDAAEHGSRRLLTRELFAVVSLMGVVRFVNLAPQPVRGRPNEPAHVVHTIAALAEARGEAPEELAALTHENAAAAFGLA